MIQIFHSEDDVPSGFLLYPMFV